MLAAHAALLANRAGRPVKMIYRRDEDLRATTKRHPARMTGQIGCDAGGRISGMVFDGLFDTGAYASWGPTVANRVPVHASGPYRTPDYIARARIERTKQMLLNPHTRISEAAFAAGFQSLSQFNRVFRRVTGESPTAHREHLHGQPETKRAGSTLAFAA